jgi:hypothetical protein
MQMLGNRSDNQQESGQPAQTQSTSTPQNSTSTAYEPDVNDDGSDDDLPF